MVTCLCTEGGAATVAVSSGCDAERGAGRRMLQLLLLELSFNPLHAFPCHLNHWMACEGEGRTLPLV